MTIRIICTSFLDKDDNLKIGGVETYLSDLSLILKNEGYKTIVYQTSDENRIINYHGVTVKKIKCNNSKKLISYMQNKEEADIKNDILIFSTDYLISKNKFKKSIAIQHGIAWDITDDNKVSTFKNCLSIIGNTIRTMKKYYKYKKCNNLVCVDYNFINWYRTQLKHIDFNYYIIPNYAKILETERKSNKRDISIVFARRLVTYRGTKLFTNAIKKVLKNSSKKINVTIAGTGPDEKWMKKELEGYKNIIFTQYESKNSIEFHSNYDIAVVPTKGSEGTSLSLLEAMSARCAVIGTNVGGITNIIINNYNGLIINPNEEELVSALNRLIEDDDLRESISRKALDTIKKSFSYDNWKSNWISIIKTIQKGK